MSDGQPIDSATLFRTHAAYVAAFLCRMGARTHDLDDLVQEVFMTAHRRGGYRPGAASPRTFLARIAIEAVRGQRRKDQRWARTRDATLATRVTGAGLSTPEEATRERRMLRRMQSALSEMDPGVRAVFVLFELQGESCAAIAAGLDVKLGTVYSRLHTARRIFQADLAEEGA